MANLQYLDHHSDIGQGMSNVGNAMARAAMGMAALRARQQQQQFENMVKLAEMEKESRLEGVREKLYGAQTEAQIANTEFDRERTLQLRGLSKLADAVEAETINEQLGDITDIEGKTYSPARGSLFADTLTNRLRIANAKKKAALEKAVILGVAPAATRLRPFNVGQFGTIDQMTGESVAPSQAPRRLHNVPPETLAIDPETEETVATGLPRTRPATAGRSARDQALIEVIRARGGGATPEEVDEIMSMVNKLFPEAPSITGSKGTNAPAGGKYKITIIK